MYRFLFESKKQNKTKQNKTKTTIDNSAPVLGEKTFASGPDPRKMIKFNPGLSQILNKVFSSKKMQSQCNLS